TARHISSETGIVAVKPTYGAISRFGVVAAVSSMDTVTPIARNTADAKALHQVMVGADELDPTSVEYNWDFSSEAAVAGGTIGVFNDQPRSEEHTSELQSRFDLVCRLLPEKKKQLQKDNVLS